MQPQKVIIFSAPSGSGKTTITNEMIRRIPQLAFSVSATSRPCRGEEKNGIDYYFLTPEEFANKIEHDDFVEWEQVYPGKYYGTLKSEVERLVANHQVPVFDIDVKGGLRVKQKFGDNALFIFIKAPVEIVEQRLHARKTDDIQSINDRIARIPEEMSFESKADVVIENIDLQKAFAECEAKILEFLKK